MKFCTQCGAQLEPSAAFCPQCGHQVGQVAKAKKTISSAALLKHLRHLAMRVKEAFTQQGKHHYGRWIVAAFVVITASFFTYRLVYLPNVVRTAVDANLLNQGGYTAKANTLTKTVVISTDDLKLERLVDAIKANDYDTTHIGAEEQLKGLAKDLPGNWQVEITQHLMKGSQTVLWRYQGDKETIRYQNSEECKLAHKTAMENKASEQAKNNAVEAGVTAGVIGGVLGAVLSR